MNNGWIKTKNIVISENSKLIQKGNFWCVWEKLPNNELIFRFYRLKNHMLFFKPLVITKQAPITVKRKWVN